MSSYDSFEKLATDKHFKYVGPHHQIGNVTTDLVKAHDIHHASKVDSLRTNTEDTQVFEPFLSVHQPDGEGGWKGR